MGVFASWRNGYRGRGSKGRNAQIESNSNDRKTVPPNTMSILCQNCMGLGKSSTVRTFKIDEVTEYELGQIEVEF
ncbi:hypothetical protein QQ045_022259 [Rhodiola kirilowii]